MSEWRVRLEYIQRSRAVFSIMAITAAFFVLDWITGWRITEFGAKSFHIWGGQLYRLVLPTFLHGGIAHLLTNMYALYIFGPVTEEILGSRRFVALYLISGAVGFIFSLLAAPHRLAVGASASIFGLMGYMLYFRLRRLPRRWLPIDSGLLQILALNLIIPQLVPNIDQWAHVGGLFGGVLSGSILGFEGVPVRSRLRRQEGAAAALFLAALLFVGLRPLDTAAALRVAAPQAAEGLEARYGPFFQAYVPTSQIFVWKYAGEGGDWRHPGERMENNRRVSLAFIWRWEPGAGFRSGSSMSYEIIWKRNGEVVASSYGRVDHPGVYLSELAPTLGSMAEGEWSVEIMADGRRLTGVTTQLRTRR